MNLEANKAVARRFFDELWNARRLPVADDIIAPDCVTHQLRSGADDSATPRAPESIKQHVAEWVAAFPDLRFTAEQMIAEGDRVVTHCTARGTHLGYWHSIPPTGKIITIQMTVIHRIADGRIAEDWVLADFLGVFQQLGIVRPTAELLAKADPGTAKAGQ